MTRGGFSAPAFAEVAAALARHAGLDIPDHRIPDLEAAARRGMAASRIEDLDEYARLVAEGHLPLADLVAAFTIGETYFFRDLPQFEELRERILPEIFRARPPDHELRAWSAGCASGEEAWSLALLLAQAAPGRRWRVLGTDVSRPSLARARKGRYREWSLRGPGRHLALEALARADDAWEVLPAYRDRVRFEYLNLAEDAYPSPVGGTAGLDLVLCRNVLIYFEPTAAAAVARRLHACLAPGGWLLTGLADPPLRDLAPLEVVSTRAGLLYRRPLDPMGRSTARTPAPAEHPAVRPERRDDAPAPSRTRAATPTSVPVREAAPVREGGAGHGPGTADLDLARAHFARGDWGAVLAAEAALLAGAEGAALLLRAAANAGDLLRAEATAARAVERHPLSVELHLLRAAIFAEQRRDPEALEALRQCLYLDRGLAVAHAARAGLLARAGDLPEARRAWRNVRRLCAAIAPETPLPLGDGRCAGPLSELASAQLSTLGGSDDDRD